MPDVTLTPAECLILFVAGVAMGVVLCVLATWVANLIERLTGWLTEPPPTTTRCNVANENQWQRPAGEFFAAPPQQPAPRFDRQTWALIGIGVSILLMILSARGVLSPAPTPVISPPPGWFEQMDAKVSKIEAQNEAFMKEARLPAATK